jgi:hypothetical protein
MPWIRELFSAPVPQRLQERGQRELEEVLQPDPEQRESDVVAEYQLRRRQPAARLMAARPSDLLRFHQGGLGRAIFEVSLRGRVQVEVGEPGVVKI